MTSTIAVSEPLAAGLRLSLAPLDYALPELIYHPGVHYEELDGEAEILPGVVILATPGHTAGHQSVVVARGDGTVVVAGQSHDNATLFTGDVLAQHSGVGHYPAWLHRILAFDPRQVVFAHDNAVWTPGTSQISGP